MQRSQSHKLSIQRRDGSRFRPFDSRTLVLISILDYMINLQTFLSSSGTTLLEFRREKQSGKNSFYLHRDLGFTTFVVTSLEDWPDCRGKVRFTGLNDLLIPIYRLPWQN